VIFFAGLRAHLFYRFCLRRIREFVIGFSLLVCLQAIHIVYCVRDVAFSYFSPFVDYFVAIVYWGVGWVTGCFVLNSVRHAAVVVLYHFLGIRPRLCPCMGFSFTLAIVLVVFGICILLGFGVFICAGVS